VRVGVRVVVAVTVDGVDDVIGDLVGCLGNSLTERVILSFFVVVAHTRTFGLTGFFDGSASSSLLYSRGRAGIVLCSYEFPGVRRWLLRRRIGGEVDFSVDDGTGALAELTLRDVNLGGAADGSSAVDRLEVPVVACILDVEVDVALDVRAAGRLVVVAVLVRANVDVYALTTVVLLGLVMTMLA
jgi:hypothetical protein